MPPFLERVFQQVQAYPETIALACDGATISYRQLWEDSDALALYVAEQGMDRNTPLAVFGHKDPLMLVCFLACVKSGHPYVPIDSSTPPSRVQDILAQIDAKTVFAVEVLDYPGAMDCEGIKAAVDAHKGQAPSRDMWVQGDELFYILFTSGSTGAPKGVQVTQNCISNFYGWALGLVGEYRDGRVFLNQAPFSFDLSVYELCMSLASGGTLFCLSKKTQGSMRELFSTFEQSAANVWVSTPSFADMCLCDKGFCSRCLPELETFLFCGETLRPWTAQRLYECFPGATVVNTYGPTESTVAVTDTVVDDAMISSGKPLPVGRAKPGTTILIWDEDGNACPPLQKGEIVIAGDTVSKGYYRRDDLTHAVFGQLESGIPYYRTGDLGYLAEDDQLHYVGRNDYQIKLSGYRIELGDIEGNIHKLPYVGAAAVVAARRDGVISHIVAYVCLNEVIAESDFKAGIKVKNDLKAFVPAYMVPKKVVICDTLPKTNNGKVDRKKLQELA